MRIATIELLFTALLVSLVGQSAHTQQYDVDQEVAPTRGPLGEVPIAKIDGPIEFSLTVTGRYVSVTLAAHPNQRSNLTISTTLTDSSCCFGFDPTYDPIPPPRLGFEIDGDRMHLLFAYAGDTAAYRLTRSVDTAGIVVNDVAVERTAGFITYSPPRPSPDRPRRRKR